MIDAYLWPSSKHLSHNLFTYYILNPVLVRSNLPHNDQSSVQIPFAPHSHSNSYLYFVLSLICVICFFISESHLGQHRCNELNDKPNTVNDNLTLSMNLIFLIYTHLNSRILLVYTKLVCETFNVSPSVPLQHSRLNKSIEYKLFSESNVV